MIYSELSILTRKKRLNTVKITVCFICSILIAGTCDHVSAQKVYRVPNTQRYFVGIKAGPLVSWPVFSDPDLKHEFSSSLVPGFNVAGLISFALKNSYSFQSELGYSRMGRKLSFSSDTWTNTSTYQFLDFSMLLRRSFRLNVGENIPANWYFNIGPNIKYWMSGKGNVVSSGPSQSYSIVFDGTSKGEYDKLFYNNANRWLFGLDVGVGVNLGTLRGQHVMAEMRFMYGHTYLGNKNSVTPQSINLLGFNDSLLSNLKVLSFSLAYTLDFYTGQSKMGKSTEKEKKKK